MDVLRACRLGTVNACRELVLVRKVNINCSHPAFEQGRSALMIACQYGHTDIARILLEREDIKLDYGCPGGRNILHAVAEKDCFEIAEYLLESDANVRMLTIKDKRGNTPLHVAAFYGNSKMVRLFLNKGAPPNSRNFAHRTPCEEANLRSDKGHDRERIRSLLRKAQPQHTMYAVLFCKPDTDVPRWFRKMADEIEIFHDFKIFYTVLQTAFHLSLVKKRDTSEVIRKTLDRLMRTSTDPDLSFHANQVLNLLLNDQIIDKSFYDIMAEYDQENRLLNRSSEKSRLTMIQALEIGTSGIICIDGSRKSMETTFRYFLSTLERARVVPACGIGGINPTPRSDDSKLVKIHALQGAIGTLINILIDHPRSGYPPEIDSLFHHIVDYLNPIHVRTVVSRRFAQKPAQRDTCNSSLERGLEEGYACVRDENINPKECFQRAVRKLDLLVRGGGSKLFFMAGLCARTLRRTEHYVDDFPQDPTTGMNSVASTQLITVQFLDTVASLEPDTFLSEADAARCPLHEAVRLCDVELLSKLLDQHPINKKDSQGRTPLDFAAFTGQYNLFRTIKCEGGRPGVLPDIDTAYLKLFERKTRFHLYLRDLHESWDIAMMNYESGSSEQSSETPTSHPP